MIIKQTRISAGGAGNAANYIQGIGENEEVHMLHGDPEGLAYYADTASEFHNHKYCLRHIIFSPDEEMRDATPLLNAFFDELDVGDRPYAMSVHYKERSSGNLVPHYHLLVAESDSRGRVLDNRNNFKRNEKMARRLEVELGHDVQKGRHNVYVVGQMQDDPVYYDVVEDLIDENITAGPLPQQAFSRKQQGKAKRLGINLAKLHNSLKEVEREALGSRRYNIGNIIKSLANSGCELLPGNKEGVLLVAESKTKEALGSLDRLSGISREEMRTLRKAIENIKGKTNGKERAGVSKGRQAGHSVDNHPVRQHDAGSGGGSNPGSKRQNSRSSYGHSKKNVQAGDSYAGDKVRTEGIHKCNFTKRSVKNRMAKAAKRNIDGFNYLHASIPSQSSSEGVGGSSLEINSDLSDSAKISSLQSFFREWAAGQKRNLGI